MYNFYLYNNHYLQVFVDAPYLHIKSLTHPNLPSTSPNTTNAFLSKDCYPGRTTPSLPSHHFIHLLAD